MDKPLNHIADAVCDEKSFLDFVNALIADRERAIEAEKQNPSSLYGPDAGGWENVSIEPFLEAAVAWAEDSNFGLNQGLAASNPWHRFAAFLYAGKIHE